MTLYALQSSVLSAAAGLSVAAGATVEVRRESDNALQALWLDLAGSETAGNPVTADVAGFFRIYLDRGDYRVTVTAQNVSATLRHWRVGPYNEDTIDLATAGDIAEIQALDTVVIGSVVLNDPIRHGIFKWVAGDFSAHVAADTTGAVYIEANAVDADTGAWVRQYDGPVNVRWFGAVGDDTTDDAAAFQAAFDLIEAGYATGLHIPATRGKYRLASPVTCSAGGLVITGDGNEFFFGSLLRIDHNGVGITVSGTVPKISGIALYSSRASYPAVVALRFAREANTDDMDIGVYDCFIQDFNVGIQTVGRGAYIQRNKLVFCDTAVTFDWPASGVEGTGLHLLPYGYRKWLIAGNHFHACGRALQNLADEPMRGAMIEGNIMDIGRSLWAGELIWSSIANNVAENCNSTVITITGSCLGVVIEGNILGGTEEPGGGDASIYQPNTAIWLNADGTIVGAVITGNVIKQVNNDGILCKRAINDCVIANNSIRDYNLSANAAYGAIRIENISGLGNAIANSVIHGNTGSAPPAGSFLKIDTGSTVSSIVDNAR